MSDREKIKNRLLEFYRKNENHLSEMKLCNVTPLLPNGENNFIFSEDWEKGDRRFKGSRRDLRFGWQMEIKPRHCWRLIATVDRFSLTLPWITDGIR